MSDAEESSSNSPCETEEEQEDGTNIRPYKYEPAAADRQPSTTQGAVDQYAGRKDQAVNLLCIRLFKFHSP